MWPRPVVTTTSSSRFVVPNYWPDPKTGIGYQVQVEVPQAVNAFDGGPRSHSDQAHRDGPTAVARRGQVVAGTMPGQYDRYNMKRQVGLTANISGEALGQVSAPN